MRKLKYRNMMLIRSMHGGYKKYIQNLYWEKKELRDNLGDFRHAWEHTTHENTEELNRYIVKCIQHAQKSVKGML